MVKQKRDQGITWTLVNPLNLKKQNGKKKNKPKPKN